MTLPIAKATAGIASGARSPAARRAEPAHNVSAASGNAASSDASDDLEVFDKARSLTAATFSTAPPPSNSSEAVESLTSGGSSVQSYALAVTQEAHGGKKGYDSVQPADVPTPSSREDVARRAATREVRFSGSAKKTEPLGKTGAHDLFTEVSEELHILEDKMHDFLAENVPPRVRANIITLFIDKGCAFFLGKVVSDMCVYTVLSFTTTKTSGGAKVRLAEIMLAWWALLIVAVLGSVVARWYFIEAQRTTDRPGVRFMKQLARGGLLMIPKWAFKDMVAAFINIMNKTTVGFEDPIPTFTYLHDATTYISSYVPCLAPALCFVWAALVMLFSTLASCFEQPADNGRLVQLFMATLGTSLALGVAFGFTMSVEAVSGGRFFKCEFQNLYAPVVTWVSWRISSIPHDVAKDQCIQSECFVRFVSRLLVYICDECSVFTCVWAWKALLTATVLAWTNGVSLGLLMESMVLACVSTGVCMIVAVAAPATMNGESKLWDLLLLVNALTVGNCWADLAVQVRIAFVEIVPPGQTVAMVLMLWLIALLSIGLICGCAFATFHVLLWLEHGAPEDQQPARMSVKHVKGLRAHCSLRAVYAEKLLRTSGGTMPEDEKLQLIRLKGPEARIEKDTE